MLVVSTREFRANQGKYLNMVKNGTEIVLKSRDNGSFTINPITEQHTIIPKKYILSPDEDLAKAISIDEAKDRVAKGIRKMFKEKQRMGKNQ